MIVLYFIFLVLLYFMPFSLSGNSLNLDKLVHFFAFAFGGLLLVAIGNSGNKKALIIFTMAILISASALEPIQGLLKYRVYSWIDAFANFIGLGAVLVGYQAFRIAKRFSVFALFLSLPLYLSFFFIQFKGVFKENFGAPSYLVLDSLLYFSVMYLALIIGKMHKIKTVFWIFFAQLLLFPLIINHLPFNTEYSEPYCFFSYSGIVAAAIVFFSLEREVFQK